MNCETCKENRPIPYIVYKSEVARLNRIVKRLAVIVVLLFAIIASMVFYMTRMCGETAVANASAEINCIDKTKAS